MNNLDTAKCTLCSSKCTHSYSKDKKREYFICENCNVIFVPQQFYLNSIQELKRYEKHNNSNTDIKYKDFLSRIVPPIIKFIKPGSIGLDFGCGPGPILKDIFQEYKIKIEEYDLYFKNNSYLLSKKWDFIVSTEVFEHLQDPNTVFTKLWDLLNPEGVLAIMTSLTDYVNEFKSWYYKGDPTHITFFSKKSFHWLMSNKFGEIQFFDKDIIILVKY
ncbi:MAG: class I SAM-dependent methyltransferase [Spirochaetales bacterium]|nr:class I SAM-dependent methyltransferase [Spirochaetales bacterium]